MALTISLYVPEGRPVGRLSLIYIIAKSFPTLTQLFSSVGFLAMYNGIWEYDLNLETAQETSKLEPESILRQ